VSANEDVDINIEHGYRWGRVSVKTLIRTTVVFIVDKSKISRQMWKEWRRVMWPMSRVRWEEQQQQQHAVQVGVGKMGNHYNHHHFRDHCDAFQGNTPSAARYEYGYAPSSSYSSTGSVGYSPG
jgi:hypothetical protein